MRSAYTVPGTQKGRRSHWLRLLQGCCLRFRLHLPGSNSISLGVAHGERDLCCVLGSGCGTPAQPWLGAFTRVLRAVCTLPAVKGTAAGTSPAAEVSWRARDAAAEAQSSTSVQPGVPLTSITKHLKQTRQHASKTTYLQLPRAGDSKSPSRVSPTGVTSHMQSAAAQGLSTALTAQTKHWKPTK